MAQTTIASLDKQALTSAKSSIGGRGRKAQVALPPTYLRDLTEADRPAISEHFQSGRGDINGSLNIQEMKTRHHMLAMVLAGGAPDQEAAFITNYTINTIVALKKSPMFRELLAYYGEQKEQEWKSFHAKAAAVGLDVLQVLHDRVLDNPDDIKTKDLKDLMDSLFDRTILPSKGANAAPAAAPPPPVNIIQFIESPHASIPAAEDKRLLDGVSYRSAEGVGKS